MSSLRTQRPKLLGLLAFVLYLAVSYRYWGWRMFPHFGRQFMGETQDPLIFIWSFAWWPHALLHGLNPFVTHELFAPQGINLVWTTSTPTLAIAFSPVTLAFGPVVAFNTVALLLPPLGAWTMYLLCRHLTASFWASLVGGYLFGFSSFILGHQQQGHLNLTAVLLLPLIALVVLRFVEGELDRRGLILRLGPLLALQFGISTEILLTATLALALSLVLGFAFARRSRKRIREAVVPVAASYGVAVLIAAPLTLYAILGFQSSGFSAADSTTSDVMDIIVPTHVNAIDGGQWPSVMGHFDDVETTIYLGPPTLLIVLLFAWRYRRSAWSRILVLVFLLALFVSFGPVLRVNGHREAPLPMWVTRWLPGFNNVHFPRLSVYLAFAAALIVALWTGRTKGWIFPRPYVLPVLAIVALAFGWWEDVNRTPHPARVAFFTTGLYKSCLPKNETLAVFPYGWFGNSMLWQAETGFRFKLAEGYMSPRVFGAAPVTGFQRDPIDNALNWSTFGRPRMDALLAFAARHHVGRFITVDSVDYPTAKQLRRFGPVEHIGGVYVAPACGSPPLTSLNLVSLEKREAHAATTNILYCDGHNAVELHSDLYPTGFLTGASPPIYVEGTGLTCDAPPSGYVDRGYAPRRFSLRPHTYLYYAPPA